MSGLKIKNIKTGAESVRRVKGVFVAIDNQPNTAPFKDVVITGDQVYFVPAAHSQVKTKKTGG